MERELGGRDLFNLRGDTEDKKKQRIINGLVDKHRGYFGADKACVQRMANFGFKNISIVSTTKPVELTIESNEESVGTCMLLVHFQAALWSFNGQKAGRYGFLLSK